MMFKKNALFLGVSSCGRNRLRRDKLPVIDGSAAEHNNLALPPPSIATPTVDYGAIFAASCASFFISHGDRANFASVFNDFLTQMQVKRLKYPKRHLDGPALKKPQNVMNENLDNFFKSSTIASSIREEQSSGSLNYLDDNDLLSENLLQRSDSFP